MDYIVDGEAPATAQAVVLHTVDGAGNAVPASSSNPLPVLGGGAIGASTDPKITDGDASIVGTPGDRTVALKASGNNDHLTFKTAPSIFANAHKVGGIFTGYAVGTLHRGATAQYGGATSRHTSSTGPGICFRFAANGIPQVRIQKEGNVSVYVRSSEGGALVDDTRFVAMWSVGEAAASWLMVNSVLTRDPFANWHASGITPSILAAESAFTLGRNGAGNDFWLTDTEWNGGFYSEELFEWGDLEPLYNSIARRHLLDQY